MQGHSLMTCERMEKTPSALPSGTVLANLKCQSGLKNKRLQGGNKIGIALKGGFGTSLVSGGHLVPSELHILNNSKAKVREWR